jgi:hypothetical protein
MLSTGGGPAWLTDAVIEGIRAQECDGVVRAWQPGQQVKVKGLDCVFRERSGARRAAVLVRMFASEYEVMAPVEMIGLA